MRLNHPLFGAGADGGEVRTLFLNELVCSVAVGAHPSEQGRRHRVAPDLAARVTISARPVNDQPGNLLDGSEQRMLKQAFCEAIADQRLALPAAARSVA